MKTNKQTNKQTKKKQKQKLQEKQKLFYNDDYIHNKNSINNNKIKTQQLRRSPLEYLLELREV